jgi:hypothetical protein
VAINVVGIGALGFIGALAAQRFGRHAFLGLLLPTYPGFVIALAKDLNEIVAACFLAAGLVALAHRKPLLATPLLTGAVFAKETTLVAAGAIFIAWAIARLRGAGERKLLDLVPAAVPAIAYAAWALVLRSRWGAFPSQQAIGEGVYELPLRAPARFVSGALRDPTVENLGQLVEVGLLVVAVVLAIAALRRSTAASSVKIGLIVMSIALVTFGRAIWVDDLAFMRAFTEGWVFASLILLADRASRYALVLLAMSAPVAAARLLAL